MASIQRRLNQPLRGVNLGGWLVLEKWMTPSLFAGTTAADEYVFCRDADADRRRTLKQFRDTFITEQDFVWLAEQGIDAVRLPVGYWLFGDAKPYIKTVQYVDRAFDWAEKHGIKVLISLHGAPASQNGKFHSGQAGIIGWNTLKYHAQTIAVLEKIAQRYKQQPALLGISFLNEPANSISKDELTAFYTSAYKRLRAICNVRTWLLFSDGFRPDDWRDTLPNTPELYMDYHHYQLASLADQKLPAWLQIQRARWLLPRRLRAIVTTHPLVIGEWSLVLTQGAIKNIPYINRSRYARRYARVQLEAFSVTNAWFYWSYKTEKPGLWSFRYCLEQDLLDID